MTEIGFLKYVSPGMLEQLVHVHISLHKKDGASAQSAQQHQTAENEEE